MPAPPDGGWGWMVVFGSFMVHVIANGIDYSIAMYRTDLLIYFDVGYSKVDWLANLMHVVTGIVGKNFVNLSFCLA